MRRGVSLVMACACAVLAGVVAVWPPTVEPDLWIVFDGMKSNDAGDLVGRFRLMRDPQVFTTNRAASTVPSIEVKLGDRVAAGRPWILDGLEGNVRRRLYYQIKALRTPMSSTKNRELYLSVKEAEVDRAILRHGATGQLARVTEVLRINRSNDELVVIYPDASILGQVAGGPRKLTRPFIEERDPPQPVRHEPGTGPLAQAEPRVWISSPYYELADGRLVYWDSLNYRLVVRTK